MKHTIKLLSLLFFVSLAGCASNSDIDALRVEVQQANANASKALQTARSANETAQDAKATADTAENKIEFLMKKNQTPKHK